jgi:hypothetical protein
MTFHISLLHFFFSLPRSATQDVFPLLYSIPLLHPKPLFLGGQDRKRGEREKREAPLCAYSKARSRNAIFVDSFFALMLCFKRCNIL